MIKEGVDLSGVKPEMVIAFIIMKDIFKRINHGGYSCTITSGREGKHKEGSKHYEGHALDFRTRNLPSYLHSGLEKQAKEDLGSQYDVVLHRTHLHVEFDPKKSNC